MANSTSTRSPVRPSSAGYQVFMLGLCLYALIMLVVQTTAPLSPETRTVLDYADFVVCGLFLVDFLISFYRAESRWSYLVKWGWLDLLSSIPTVDVVRWGRLGRVIRVFRALRALRATRLIARMVLERRAENTILAAALAALLLVVFCSIAVLYFENDPVGYCIVKRTLRKPEGASDSAKCAFAESHDDSWFYNFNLPAEMRRAVVKPLTFDRPLKTSRLQAEDRVRQEDHMLGRPFAGLRYGYAD